MMKTGQHSTMTLVLVGLGGVAVGVLGKMQYDKMQAAAAQARLQQSAPASGIPAGYAYAS